MPATLERQSRQSAPDSPADRIRADIALQRALDRRRTWDMERFERRFHAVMEAHDAYVAGETGAAYAFRQALVDLASACEMQGVTLPAPRILPGT